MNKQVLREIYLEKRMLLTANELNKRNHAMKSIFFREIDLENIRHLHVFLPIETKKEPNTWLLIDELQAKHPGIGIVISKTHPNGQLSHYLFESRNQLALNKWNIPEPQFGQEISPDQIDLVLVPMVVFDLKGNRIGYGKGYYDRFLAQLPESIFKVGYCLSPPLDDLNYIETTDIGMDACITHLGLNTFN